MCTGPGADYKRHGPFELTVTEGERDRFVLALQAVLFGEEPDLRTIREMRVRLRRATEIRCK
jgi:hypothetical protein